MCVYVCARVCVGRPRSLARKNKGCGGGGDGGDGAPPAKAPCENAQLGGPIQTLTVDKAGDGVVLMGDALAFWSVRPGRATVTL